MKAISFFLMFMLFLASERTRASEPMQQRSCMFRSISFSNDSLDHVRYVRNMEHYRRMKTTGAILTGVGGGMFVVGEALLWTGVAQTINTDENSSQSKLWVAGSLITAASLAFIIPGIVMLVRGTRRYHHVSTPEEDKNFNGVIIH